MKVKHILLLIGIAYFAAIALSIIIDSWIPFGLLILVPIFLFLVGIMVFFIAKTKSVNVVVIDRSNIPKEFQKYMSDDEDIEKEAMH